MQNQLLLGIHLREEANFESWYIGDNQELSAALSDLVANSRGRYVYLWGGSGVGKSHLLQASCQSVLQAGNLSFYLPLGQDEIYSTAILENLDNYSLICLDNIEEIIGQASWEEALFHFFNRVVHTGSGLVIAGTTPPSQLEVKLADLKSRLSSGVVYQIKPLNDDHKIKALQLRAHLKGLSLSLDVGRYLLNHYPRDICQLFASLDRLDQASLAALKPLTIPFVKTILNSL